MNTVKTHTDKIKHMAKTNANISERLALIYRSIPEAEEFALVIKIDLLSEPDKNRLIDIIGHQTSQDANDLADVLAKNNLLQYYHSAGLLHKISIDNVIVVLNASTEIALRDLLIAEGKLKNVNDDVVEENQQIDVAQIGENIPEDQKIDRAKMLLIQSDMMRKEALKMKADAFEMAPSLKPVRKKTPAKKTATKGRKKATAKKSK